MSDLFDAVHEFNSEITGAARQFIMPMMPFEAQFVINAVREEVFVEFRAAVNSDNVVGQVDAIVDAIYYLVGGLYRLGLTPDEARRCFEVVHLCNMQKGLGKRDNRESPVESDAIKPEHWEGPEEVLKAILGERSCP